MANASSLAASIKRKRNDPNLETITLDPHYDLVLIVSTPAHPDGQKAFLVNKGSMRHVSDIWTKMLTGDWVESKQSEIEFPEDSWKPFEVVLKIAHFQVAALPDLMSFEGLQALAKLTDKYNLTGAVRMGLDLKQWLHRYKDTWTAWPSQTNTQHFAFMTSVFQYSSDLAFLTSKLAVEVQVDKKELFRYYGPANTRLATSLPDALLANINKIRNSVLWELIGLCKLAITNATQADKKAPCGTAQCKALKVGILVTDLTAAGLYPIPGDAKELHCNVLSYWRAVNRIGAAHALYRPCDKLQTHNYYSKMHGTNTQCSYAKCFEDFGIKDAAKHMLEQRVHADVYAHMQTDACMEAMYIRIRLKGPSFEGFGGFLESDSG